MSESLSFDCAADFYDETRGGLPRGRGFARAISQHLGLHSRVLEVGIGTGLIALPLTELGHDVIGVDLAPAMIAKAQDRIGSQVAVGDAARLPIASASVDAVIAVWVLHVVGDREAVLRDIARVLRPKGRLLVIPADAEEEDDEITRANGDIRIRLRRVRDLPEVVCDLAASTGFSLASQGHTGRYEYEQSPREMVAGLERREWSALWNIDDASWDDIVQPVIDRLASLPDPDRPRRRALAHHLLVFNRASS